MSNLTSIIQDTLLVILIILVIIVLIVFVALTPKFEAEAFNKCTGGNATYMTALFTELRVENCKSN